MFAIHSIATKADFATAVANGANGRNPKADIGRAFNDLYLNSYPPPVQRASLTRFVALS
jgi:hypothetical protein